MPRGRWISSWCVSVAVLVLGAAAAPLNALASIHYPQVVSADPANHTPVVLDDEHVANAAVHAFSQAGDTMYTGGDFHGVANAARTQSYVRQNLMAFSVSTGELLPFAPAVEGRVWALLATGDAVFVGGDFRHVDGELRRGLVKLNPVTGELIGQFEPSIRSGEVYDVKLVAGRLIVAGSFPKRLVALDPTTGADTGFIDLGIGGKVADNAGRPDVLSFSVNPAGTRLVALGNFGTVAGAPRSRAFMADLDGPRATLNAWDYPHLRSSCHNVHSPAYLRDVDFSPDGSYFVIVSTGGYALDGEVGRSLCDAAARFDTSDPAPALPVWINYTGGDTLTSVAVTGSAVYVQGHQRWLDNPQGRNDAGPGAVPRPGIGAISPVSGTALPWNPGKSREEGGRVLLATSTGLWVGSDGRTFGDEPRAGIAFCPL